MLYIFSPQSDAGFVDDENSALLPLKKKSDGALPGLGHCSAAMLLFPSASTTYNCLDVPDVLPLIPLSNL
jgi:hypothetical protein